ncbi:hypothetical protein K8Q98_01810 [Candidatus Nomurabacteria bacterium]|nr:hypothetical protein [Candidatus Nomurabacteria bacterium]
MEKLEWSALEYEEKERTADWFWALGIVIVTSALASIIYSNYFFATLLLLSGALLGFFAIKKPDVVNYELNDKGLKIGTRIFLYENIKSFWVANTPELGEHPKLFIKSERAFMPIISVPVIGEYITHIKSMMVAKNIPEEEMKEHASEKIMDFLGF